jgi:hypothetical protein
VRDLWHKGHLAGQGILGNGGVGGHVGQDVPLQLLIACRGQQSEGGYKGGGDREVVTREAGMVTGRWVQGRWGW